MVCCIRAGVPAVPAPARTAADARAAAGAADAPRDAKAVPPRWRWVPEPATRVTTVDRHATPPQHASAAGRHHGCTTAASCRADDDPAPRHDWPARHPPPDGGHATAAGATPLRHGVPGTGDAATAPGAPLHALAATPVNATAVDATPAAAAAAGKAPSPHNAHAGTATTLPVSDARATVHDGVGTTATARHDGALPVRAHEHAHGWGTPDGLPGIQHAGW